MTLTILGPAPKTGHHPRVLVRCDCGVEFAAERHRVARGVVKMCVKCARPRMTEAERVERRRLSNKARPLRRKSDEMPELVTVPRLVPASHWRTDAAVIGALLIALRLPFDELSFLEPIDADVLRELAGLDEDDLDRATLRRWLESDGVRVYGVRCPASLVFGASEVGEVRSPVAA